MIIRHSSILDTLSRKITYHIGTSSSIVIHTILFIGIFSLRFFGQSTEEILLILTTAVSLEAIYLAIFIQMTVNRTTESLAGVEEDIDDIQEDIDDIQEDVSEDSTEDVDMVKVLKDMELRLQDLQKDIATLQKQKKS
ncbi:MAG: hypothetical protein UW88_C0006G0036 [Candidatus Collierbacteria bacterium GW2011_GWD2_45_10]|uniref:DUF1003 domain-containing protein n=1 Tax=Candidatus Collierbacteria bacterium GW2011_GWB2_44_22 TaxID=1618387 RepID=A0A0G1I0F6_9BACT|nr:MAG: hypothetical protein UW31_C0007G0077 [Candidatus Collierbacteria bacterium GW2011_GWA2_44_13]KKT50473.1 MAG: hypothetical protein UW42_C0018G0013 [Candidatus Collierbacteria bacterium GW2011_GWB1_44_197]KKT52308.1 MAG: hypothetical protein UW44_C0003G0151 [Candidatus Collierbacteria bacterium GW2011_GWB2_44_22]KKT63228.1 MAG: hypothetical protein UW56_C0001G0065 [Candidatus Collierbacteria bacterium GW2011_GWD1_44_27]KKT65729.1 MAG: hypothetical protein UW58_C0021G0007 [Candidatus Colli